MATTVEIVRTIQQIAADSMDHPYGGKKTGVLEREKGHIVNDSRVWDGFKVKMGGNILTITYHSETTIKDSHQPGFESDLEQTLEQLASFIKKEYKSITGDSLTLKAVGEMNAIVQEMSRIRCWVQATKDYKIGQLDEPDDVRADRKKVYDELDTVLSEKYQIEKNWKRFINGEDE